MTDYGYAIDPRPAELGGGWHHSPPFPFGALVAFSAASVTSSRTTAAC